MKSRKKTAQSRKLKGSAATPSPLGRKASAVKLQQKKDAITAALEESQRRSARVTASAASIELSRAVEAGQRRRKTEGVTGALKASQRKTPGKPDPSDTLARQVAERERLHKKETISSALKKSQRRSAPGET